MVASREPVRLNIPLIVRRTIRHARKLSRTYEWPVAREALIRILTDLEARGGDDPSLDKLRSIIQRGDQKVGLRPTSVPPTDYNAYLTLGRSVRAGPHSRPRARCRRADDPVLLPNY